jgi:hypothetical protein
MSNFIVSPDCEGMPAVYPTGPFRTIVAVAALLALLFAQQQQLVTMPGSGRVANAVPDALHGPWFAVVTWFVASFVNKRTRGWATIGLTAILGVLLAVGTEVLQRLNGGDAEWGDVICDLLGMTAALSVWAARRNLQPPRPAIGIAVVLLGLSQWPFVHALLVDRYSDSIAPELLGFDSVFARDLLTSRSTVAFVAPPAAWPVDHSVLRIELAAERYPGVHLGDPISDWRQYATLSVAAYVEGSLPLPITISIRLDNAPVDHVYRTFDCAPGPCAIRWPLESAFDRNVARVNAVVMHSTRGYAGRVVYIGRVALED